MASGNQPGSMLASLAFMKKLLFVFLLTTSAVAAQAQQPTRIGHANVAYIISKLPEFKEIQDDLVAQQSELEKQYVAKRQAFQQKYEQYVQQAASLPDTTRSRLERELESMSMELQNFESDAQRTFENMQKLALAPVYLRVNSAIREVAQEHGYEIILNSGTRGADLLLFAGEADDISDLVVSKLSGSQPPEK